MAGIIRAIGTLTFGLAITTTNADERAGFNYTFVEGGAISTEINNDDLGSSTGWGLSGSLALSENIYITADYTLDDFGSDRVLGLESKIELDSRRLGFGFHAPISDKVDFIASATWIELEVKLNNDFEKLGILGPKTDGYSTNVGVRSWLTKGLEFDFEFRYQEFGNDGNQFVGITRLLYSVTPGFALGLTATKWDAEGATYGIEGRFYFGN